MLRRQPFDDLRWRQGDTGGLADLGIGSALLLGAGASLVGRLIPQNPASWSRVFAVWTLAVLMFLGVSFGKRATRRVRKRLEALATLATTVSPKPVSFGWVLIATIAFASALGLIILAWRSVTLQISRSPSSALLILLAFLLASFEGGQGLWGRNPRLVSLGICFLGLAVAVPWIPSEYTYIVVFSVLGLGTTLSGSIRLHAAGRKKGAFRL